MGLTISRTYTQNLISHICCLSCKNLKKLLKDKCDSEITRVDTYKDINTMNVFCCVICEDVHTNEKCRHKVKLNMEILSNIRRRYGSYE